MSTNGFEYVDEDEMRKYNQSLSHKARFALHVTPMAKVPVFNLGALRGHILCARRSSAEQNTRVPPAQASEILMNARPALFPSQILAIKVQPHERQ
jgi:hypothetical protein